ncbi:MAG TPA: hypothetical protein VH328_04530, partial [Burkholderiaceae bacterium]|nr:hypothetical protein [Burkholderiaceae bacterium]
MPPSPPLDLAPEVPGLLFDLEQFAGVLHASPRLTGLPDQVLGVIEGIPVRVMDVMENIVEIESGVTVVE